MIPAKEHWHSMDSAPKDGTIFMVLHKAYNKKDGKDQVQSCQYFCNEYGLDWRWRSPYRTGVTVYADAWMTLAELIAWQEREPAPEPVKPAPAPEPAPAAPDEDFDL